MKLKPRILLIGANGQLGHELALTLPSVGDVIALTRAELDFADASHVQANIQSLVAIHHPDVIVNAAAYTAVDKAESEPELAHLINTEAVRYLAKAANESGACFIHYSTDYVFDGDEPLSHRYAETDSANPQSVYGTTKRLGELAIEQTCQRHLIFRTSWVVGQHGNNFLKTMLRLAQTQAQLTVVDDQWGAPTAAVLIAQTTAYVLSSMHEQPADDPRWGTYHLTADGVVTWHAYAQYVIGFAAAAGLPMRITQQTILPISTKDYPVAAKRPRNSQLQTHKLRQRFKVVLPDWRQGVDSVLTQVLGSAQPSSTQLKHKS